MSNYLTKLTIRHFRNLTRVEVQPSASFNVLYGDNASGKTSYLEAIYYLGLARSFRSRLAPRIITHEEASLSISAIVSSQNRALRLGIERQQNGHSTIRMDGEPTKTIAALAEVLPLQLINSTSDQLLLAGPEPKRQFLDWGVFHVEHTFLNIWQDYYRALKQRNAALKQQRPLSQIKLWDEALSQTGTAIHHQREDYLNKLMPIFSNLWQNLMGTNEIELDYMQGWPKMKSLRECLDSSTSRDFQLGYTCLGIHRANLLLTSRKTPVQDILSRGQQKLLVYALRLAQGQLLEQQTGKTCIYLIDDLATELDQDKRQQAAKALTALAAQVFVTGVFKNDLKDLLDLNGSKLFHVEQGKITEKN